MRRKILSLILAELMILGQVGPLYATNESFVQTDWSGGASSDAAVSPGNKTGWTKYSTKDTYVSTPAGEVTLSPQTTTALDDTDTDFAKGTLSNLSISGTGASAVVKPPATVNDPFRTGLRQWGMPSMLPQDFASSRLSNVCWPGGGNYLYLLDSCTGLFVRYNLSNETWSTLGSPEKQLGKVLGSGVYLAGDPSDSNIIYAVAGGDKTNFLKYTISTNTWEAKAPVSAGGANDPRAYYGASMTPGYDESGNPVLYLACGGDTNTFLRYNITANTWTTMPTVPITVNFSNIYYLNYSGTKYVYCFQRDGDDVHKFNVSSGTWSTPTTALGLNYYYATANMAYPGTGNILYVTRGGSEALTAMLEYNLSTDSYNTASSYYGMPNGISAGGSICFVGNSGVGATSNKIYLFQGEGYHISNAWSATMPAFDVSTQKWNKTTSHPWFVQYWGSDAVYVSSQNALYVANGFNDASNGVVFLKYSIADNRWERLTDMPFIDYCGALAYDSTNGRIWLLGGNTTTNFAYYSIAGGTWTNLTATNAPPVNFQIGASMVFVPGGSGALYATPGLNTTGFYKYDIASGSWTQKTAVSGTVEHGGDLIYPGAAGLEDYIYCVRGNETNNFYRYSISGNSWSSMASVPATLLGKSCTNVEDGGSLAYNNGYIYLIDSEGGSTIQRYNISANNWEDGSGNYKGWWLNDPIQGGGAWIVSDGTYLYYSTGGCWREHFMTRFTIATETFDWVRPSFSDCYRSSNSAAVTANGSTYMLMGENSQLFFKYTASTDTWEMLAPLPVKCWYSADLAFGGGDYIYCLAYSNKFYRYSISTNTWTQRADCLYAFSNGAALVGWDANTVYATTGGDTNFLKYDNTTNSWIGAASLLANSGSGTTLIKAGSYVYALRAANSTSFARFDGNSWTALASTNNNADYGASMVFAEDAQGTDYIFMICGTDYTNFERYSIAGNSWTSLTKTPERCDAGSKLFYPGSGDIVYLLPVVRYYYYRNYGLGNIWTAGYTSNGIYEYSIANSAWNTTANASYSVDFRQPALGKSLVYYEYGGERYLAMRQEGLYSCCGPNIKEIRLELYDIDNYAWTDKGTYHATIGSGTNPCAGVVWPGHSDYDGYLYILHGYGTTAMSKYSFATGQITSSTAAPATIYGGSYPVYPDSGDYFYMFRGNNTRTFYRFNMATAAWDDAGAVDLPAGASAVNGGGCLEAANGTFYHVEGNNTRGFWSWTPGDGSWSQKAYLPWKTYWGVCLVYPGFGDYIYCFRGRETRDWAKYSISGNTWTELPPLPYLVADNASCAYDPVTGEVYIASGYLSTSIKKMNLAQIGTYLSDIKQIGDKVGWENITWVNNSNGGVTMKVRSSTSPSMTGATDFVTTDNIAKGSDMTNMNTVTDTHQYIQYQAKIIADDLGNLPELNSASLNYINYSSPQTLISSAYDTAKDTNRLMGISWTESLESGTDIKFQFRTAATQAGLNSSSWYGPTGNNTFVNDFSTSSDYAMDSRVKVSGGAAVLKADLEDMQYKQSITIDNSAGGALSPAIVKVTVTSGYSNFWTHIQSDGDDMRFHDGTNKLDYYLYSFDYAGQTAKFYVRVPSIAAGQTKTIYMLYGSANAVSESSIAAMDSFPKIAIFCQTLDNNWMTAAVKEDTRDYILANVTVSPSITVYDYDLTGQTNLLSWMAANQNDPAHILIVFDVGPGSVDTSATNDYDDWINAGNMVIWTGDQPFYWYINTAGASTAVGDTGIAANLGTGITAVTAGSMVVTADGTTYIPSLSNYTSDSRCGLKSAFTAAGWNSVAAFADDSATHNITDAYVAIKSSTSGGYYAQFFCDNDHTGAQRGAAITQFINNWVKENCATFNITGTVVTPESESANGYSIAGTYTILNPVIQPVYGAFYNNDLNAFTATQTTPAGTAIKYQVSANGYRWFYYTGSAWEEVTGGYSQTNTSSEVSSNLSSFMSTVASSGEFIYRAYLNSTTGTATPSLDNINIVMNPNPTFYINPSGGETINPEHSNKIADRWFQYRLMLYSMGMNKPTLNDITVEYVNPLILNTWDLNMNTGVLTLHFNQVAKRSTLDMTKITLQNAATATTSYTLTGGSCPAGDNANIVITLSGTDLNAIKTAGICTSSANSYLRMTSAVIQDLLSNQAVAIADGSAQQVTTFTADTTAPTFSSWTLDMNAKTMALTFSEPVNGSTWDATKVTLQNTAASPTVSYTLTNSTTTSANGLTKTITLSTTDYNAIAQVSGLATAQSNSYLSMALGAIKDVAGNNIAAMASGIQASSYTANAATAAKFKITTSAGATMTAGTTKVISIKAYDSTDYLTVTYSGDKTLIFSGANASTDGYSPEAKDKNNNGIVFGNNTVLTFASGIASTTLTLYCRENALIKAAQGGINTATPDALTITVNPESAVKLAFSQQPSSAGTVNVNLVQQPKVAIQDTYGNRTNDTYEITIYDSSNGAYYSDASGTLSATANPVAATAGEASFSGVKYNTTGTIYLYAEYGSLSPAFSNAITFSMIASSTVDASASPIANFDLIPTNDTVANKFNVLKFKVKDAGGDSIGTLIDRIQIAIAGTGANASTDIAWAGLNKELLGSNLVTNGDMELDSVWIDYNTPVTNERSSEQVHTGTYSRKLVTDGNDGIRNSGNTWTTTTNKIYKLSFWVYPVNQTEFGFEIRKGDGSGWLLDVYASGLTANTWNLVEKYYKESAGGAGAYIVLYDRRPNIGTWYIDDVWVQEVTDTTSPTLGVNLVSNGDFSGWTGDNPNSWTINESGSNVVTENSGKCRIVSDSTPVSLYQSIMTVGKTYKISFNVTNVTSGSIKLQDEVSGDYGAAYYYSTTGVKTLYWTARGTRFIIARGAACDVTIDDVSVQEVTSFSSQIATATGSAITNSMITFGSTPDAGSDGDLTSVADGTSVEYTIHIYMKDGKLTAAEQNTYTFDVNETNIGTDTAVSSQMTSDSGAITLVTGTIKVDTSMLEIVDAGDNSAITATAGATTELKIRATDANKNIDKDYTGNKTLQFSGLSTIGVYKPKIESVAFGFNITVHFTQGVSDSGAVTLTAYKKETANLSVSEVGQSYSVFTLAATINSATAATLSLVSGNSQTGKRSTALSNPLVVAATDTYGNGVPDITVNFAITSVPGGASGQTITPASAASNASGQAQTTLTLGNLSGDYQVTASSTLTGTPVFTATAYTPAALNKVSGDSPVQEKAVVLALDNPFVVKLVDASSNGIPGETIDFSILSVPTGATGQVLSAASGVTNASGEAQTTLTLGNKTGTYIVRASFESFTADFTATAIAGSPYKVVLSGPSSVVAGAPSTAFTITIQDQQNNLSNVSQNTVFNLTTTPADTGSFYSDSGCTTAVTQRTVANGTSSITFYYKHTSATTITITATRASGQSLTVVSSSIATFSIVPADLSYFKVTGITTDLTAGSSRTITVTAYDTHNNIKTNYTQVLGVTFSGANASPLVTNPTCSDNASVDRAFGVSTNLQFTNGTADSTLKVYKVETVHIKATASAITTSDANDLDFLVIHNNADHLKFAADLPSAAKTSGTAFNFETNLNAVDAYGNLCNGANGATAYTQTAKTIIWTLNGTANGPESGTDTYTNPVSFTNGVSSTALNATLYRAQTTTITASVTGLGGTNEASNSITINAADINKLRFSQQPAAAAIANQAFTTQPKAAVADQYGNPCSTATAQITLRGSTVSGSYSAVTNGSLSADALTKNLSNGEAVFSGMKYSYPETIYLEASVVGYSLTAVYSFGIACDTTTDLTAAKITDGLSDEVSSIANTTADKVNVFSFKITDTDTDDYGLEIKKIAVNRSGSDTAGDWTNYINGVAITDGTTSYNGIVEANKVYFGTGTTTIYSIAENTNKTYTVSVYLKSSLPADADGKVLGFSMDANTDITTTVTSSKFAEVAAIEDTATVKVIATGFLVTGSASAMTTGGSNTLTIKAIDINKNIDKDYAGYKALVFSGGSTSPSGQKPACTNFGSTAIDFGSVTDVEFVAGVNSSAVTMKLYTAEIAVIKTTQSSLVTATANALTVTVSAGSAYRLFWHTQPTDKIVANAPWKEFIISVADQYGNTTSSSIDVTVTPTGGTLSSAATQTVTASGGLARFINFAVTCASYPGTVTLNGSAAGIGVDTGASNNVTVEEQYSITINAKDSVTNSQLTDLTLEILKSGTRVYGPTKANSPFTGINLNYGVYTFKLTKEKYVDSSTEKTAGVPGDALDGSYDNKIAWTIYVTSLEEATADYQVKSSFVYDEDGEDLAVRLWLERRGKLVLNDEINKLGIASIDIYYESGGDPLKTISFTAPDQADLTTGVYKKVIENVLTAGGVIGTNPLVSGRTYYVRCKINYGGPTADARTYEGGTTFTVTITQKLNKEIIGKLGVGTGETLLDKLETKMLSESELTRLKLTQGLTATEAKIAADTVSTQAKIAAAQSDTLSNITSAKTEIKVDTAKILTAAETTIPSKMSETETALKQEVQTSRKSEILNRDNVVRIGQSLTVRYRTYSGLSPTIDVYNDKNVKKVSSQKMLEIGTTGIYEYNVTFYAAWGKGDYTILCSESNYGTMDALVVTALRTDIEQIDGSVSAVLGSTSNISDLKKVTTGINSQFNVLESALSKIGRNLTDKVKEATSSATALESVFGQLSNMAKQIKQMVGETSDVNLEKLYEVSSEKKEDLIYLKNKTQQLKAAMDINQKLVENIANKPITETWYEYK